MKKFNFYLTTLTSLFVGLSSALAQTTNTGNIQNTEVNNTINLVSDNSNKFYVGTGLGYAIHKNNTTATSENKSSVSKFFRFGKHIDKYIFGEVTYYDIGNYDAVLSNGSKSLKALALAADVGLRAPAFHPKAHLFAKLGISYLDIESKTIAGNETTIERGTSLLRGGIAPRFGIGGDYRINPYLSIRGDFETFGKQNGHSVNNYAATIQYHF